MLSLRRRLSDATLGRAVAWGVRPERVHHLLRLPALPGLGRFRRTPRSEGYWPEFTASVPEVLRGTPGDPVDEEIATAASNTAPLRDLWSANKAWEDYLVVAWWRFSPWFIGPFTRANRRLVTVGQRPGGRRRRPLAPDTLASIIRARAAELGLSQVGFATYDERWTFVEHAGTHDTGSVVVCLLEEDYEAEQRAPSAYHETRSMAQYAEQAAQLAELATYIQSLGYRAQPHDSNGPMMYIPYAVAAGLGQLGLNGQLLTPLAGARCTIAAITTDAPIAHGTPRDFGIAKICDACRACVRRCPVGAIPLRRASHRGVYKAKINTGRCIATVVRADGCAVCSKVCPVQRYGLHRVYEHFEATGTVLGRDTAELETFAWPLDARTYGPGKKPRIDSAVFMHPGGLSFDPSVLTAPSRGSRDADVEGQSGSASASNSSKNRG